MSSKCAVMSDINFLSCGLVHWFTGGCSVRQDSAAISTVTIHCWWPWRRAKCVLIWRWLWDTMIDSCVFLAGLITSGVFKTYILLPLLSPFLHILGTQTQPFLLFLKQECSPCCDTRIPKRVPRIEIMDESYAPMAGMCCSTTWRAQRGYCVQTLKCTHLFLPVHMG